MKINMDSVWMTGDIHTVQQCVHDVMRQGRFLRSLRIDDVESPFDELERASLSETSIITVESCTFDELIEDYMQSCNNLLPSLYQTTLVAADTITVGEVERGLQLVYDILKGIASPLTLLDQIVQRAPEPGTLVEQIYQAGTRNLEETVNLAEAKDYVALADTLTYEFAPWLTDFFGMTSMFLQQMRLEHVKESLHSGYTETESSQ